MSIDFKAAVRPVENQMNARNISDALNSALGSYFKTKGVLTQTERAERYRILKESSLNRALGILGDGTKNLVNKTLADDSLNPLQKLGVQGFGDQASAIMDLMRNNAINADEGMALLLKYNSALGEAGTDIQKERIKATTPNPFANNLGQPILSNPGLGSQFSGFMSDLIRAGQGFINHSPFGSRTQDGSALDAAVLKYRDRFKNNQMGN